MIDPKRLSSDLDSVASNLATRGVQLDVPAIKALATERKRLQLELEQLQRQRNQHSKKVAKAKASQEDTSQLMAEALELGKRLQQSQVAAQQVKERWHTIALEIPNLLDASVPEGKDATDNSILYSWGQLPEFSFEPKDHLDLGVRLGLDFEAASKMSGSRFTVMLGDLAKLHRALIQFMLEVHIQEHNYKEIYVPFIVKAESLQGTGQLPKFAEDLFQIKGEDNDNPYYLIPTAEVPVTNYLRDQIFEGELPLKLVCHSPCFRREAGSYGRDVRGMIRQHQFEKVELVQFVTPETSEQALEALTADAERILQKLKLAYRRVLLCSGDIGFAAARTYDLEVWLPSQHCYREISSCSNFREFQCRRMQARYRNQQGKPELLHSLNGSGLAIGRTLVAIMENYQREDGSILIPEALQGYMQGQQLISPSL